MQTEGLPLGGPSPLRRRTAQGRLAHGLAQAPQAGLGGQGVERLEGSPEGKVQQGRGRQGEAALAQGAPAATSVHARQPAPIPQ